jgi:hypothetical protein
MARKVGSEDGKAKKRKNLAKNKKAGKDAEEIWAASNRIIGHKVTRTGRGSDYQIKKRNGWTGKSERAYNVEVKSSDTAKKSPLQKKTRSRKVVEKPPKWW